MSLLMSPKESNLTLKVRDNIGHQNVEYVEYRVHSSYMNALTTYWSMNIIYHDMKYRLDHKAINLVH